MATVKISSEFFENEIRNYSNWEQAFWRELFQNSIDAGSTEINISYEKIGTSTIQSRATGGVAGATYIFVLPGSPGACKDAWDGILAQQLDYRHRPCNFVEIMPRLDEHLRRGKAK